MSQNNNTQKSQFFKKDKLIEVSQNADGVVCDGGIGDLGHPQVWYGFDNNGYASCHYCGRKFSKTKAE